MQLSPYPPSPSRRRRGRKLATNPQRATRPGLTSISSSDTLPSTADLLREELRRIAYEVSPTSGLTAVLIRSHAKAAFAALRSDCPVALAEALTKLRRIK